MILFSLPFIKTNVSVTANGIITTSTNRYELSTPTSGLLPGFHLKENMIVKEGDTLLVFDNAILHKEQQQIDSRLSELGDFLEDREKLVRNDMKPNTQLVSSRFQIAFLKYQTELEKLNIEKEALKKIYERQEKTGTPMEFAQKLNISKSKLYELLGDLKSLGMEVKYNRRQKTFYYADSSKLNIIFSLKLIKQEEIKIFMEA